LAWAAPVAIGVASLGVAALADARPRGDRIAAVFPPWWTAEQALASALAVAPVAGVGRFSFIVAAHARGPETAASLRAAGAWLTLDGSRFSFCMTK